MTDVQRKKIDLLRKQGFGYKRIAVLLCLSTNTVKSYCRTHSLDDESDNCCALCGKSIEQTSHKKKRKFCSDECRLAWWSAHPEARTVKKRYKHICAFCGRAFTSPRAGTKYCTSSCYAKARRKTDA